MDPAEFERDVGRFNRHVKRTFVTGLLVLIPTVVTIWVLYVLFVAVDAVLGNLLARATGIRIPGLGLLLTVLIVYSVGLFASNLGGKRIISWFEGLMTRVPLVRSIYRVSKEVSLAFGKKENRPFRKVVALEFPRKGIWSLGFLTADVPERSPSPNDSVYIFIPTTPNPTSGWLLMVPKEDVLSTPYTVDEAMRIIISAGIVSSEETIEEDSEGRRKVIARPDRGGGPE